jgi:recombinational DNA repair protein (RecF pathway)
MSHHIYTTPAFVISSAHTGEANKLLHVFTRDLGMVVATVQGIRHEKSKLRPHVQDYSFTTLSLVRGKDMWRVTGAQATESSFVASVRHHEPSYRLYVQILALLKRLLPGEEKNEPLYEVFVDACTYLGGVTLEGEQLLHFEYTLVLRILSNLGYVSAHPSLSEVLEQPWTDDLLENMKKVAPRALAEINRAIKVSQM